MPKKYVKKPYRKRLYRRRKFIRRRKGLIGKALYPTYRMRPERKMYDLKAFWDDETFDSYTNYSVFSLNAGIAQGTNDGQRIGNRVTVKSLHIVGEVTASPSNPVSAFRIAVVLDRFPNQNIVPTWSDIWESSGTSATNLVPLRNSSTPQRYVVLYSRMFSVGYITQTGTSLASLGTAAPPKRFINIYKRMNLPVQYTGTDTNLIQTNNIVIFGWSDTNVNTPRADFNARIEYVDN